MSGKILPFRRPAVPSPNLSDEALLAACATGDTAALGELFERFHTAVYRVLGRYMGATCDELDDLVQATFLEVLRAASRFERRATVRAFILGIALNVARHHLRSERRRRHLEDRSGRQPLPVAAGPERGAAQKELFRLLESALQNLPHDLRVAFVLCDLEELKGAEVSRVLGIPEGTLWRRLYDARRALRQVLGEVLS